MNAPLSACAFPTRLIGNSLFSDFSRGLARSFEVGKRFGTISFQNCRWCHPFCAVRRNFFQRGAGPTAVNLFAGSIPMWHAVGVPEAL
jgi:hypothetical protein